MNKEYGNNTTSNVTDTCIATASNIYNNVCPNRLPCGICRILMCNCPKGWSSNITWTATNTGGIDNG